MNCAAARAAIRRGSSITIFCPASHGASSSASGTWVVLPAPGGASSTSRGCAASDARICGSSGVIGNGGGALLIARMIAGATVRLPRRRAGAGAGYGFAPAGAGARSGSSDSNLLW